MPPENTSPERAIPTPAEKLSQDHPERVSLTPAEFANVTGAKIKAVRRHIASGELKAVRLGNLLYIPISEINRLFGDAA